MRLIDADALTFDRLTDSICQGQAEDVVAEAPTIDIVTCGDCKYYRKSKYFADHMVCEYHLGHTYYTEPERFCSHGERRTDEQKRL